MASSKPCPGCKQVKDYRKSTDVCSDCERAIAEHKEATQLLKEMQSTPALMSFEVGEAHHWNEYIRTHSKQDILEGLHEIVIEASSPFGLYELNRFNFSQGLPTLIGKAGSRGSGILQRVIKKSVGEAISSLYKMLVIAFEEAYQNGKKDGRALLKSLASGDMSPNDYMNK